MEVSWNKSFFEIDQDLLAPLYAKAPVDFVKGKGSYLIDAEGEKYLDFVSGIAVNSLGHAFEPIVKAIREQSQKFNHLSNLYPSEAQLKLAEALLENTPFDKAFFCNSGTEANEAAIKFARKYFNRNGEADRVEIITFFNSFHGRTFGALSATGQPSLREGFGSMPGDFVHIAWNDVEALQKKVHSKTCAILLEPMVAEGGILSLAPEMVKAINEAREKHACLVIADEIQTGMGRLGSLFAFEKYGLNVDLLTMAKALGAGLPLGACLMRQKIADQLKPGDHGTTFGGNPIACAAGLAALEVIREKDFLNTVQERSEQLQKGLQKLLQKYDFLGEIRGDGLLLGVTSDRAVADLIASAREEKLLILRAGANVLRLLPPLNVSEQEVQEALEKLDKTFAKHV